MSGAYYIISAALFVLEMPETKALLENSNDCCERIKRMNETCANITLCDPGLRNENSTHFCMSCDSPEQRNSTLNNTRTSHTPVPAIKSIGGPGIAASVLLGTLLISLGLILSVASFFYLKRSNRLSGLFYRRNKAFIFQPSETAVMIPEATSSVRKPRYVKRERPLSTSASKSATVATDGVTKVYNV
ncbi:uncharacterized protein C1orf159-like [Myxocyprinus asiaticus]|uniref:uncharacterized protein C1orf159-like n=1 Tax=Myxocyprinus asiaticus TaxID=70543 RepID=UPI00222167E7|nr:uncharacterized protein C1orf159-like [Myxocyprinus asiaticus]XP_051562734.1 uncharacterized protein C1orf159-like [Myxocyprinus asiaticus]XP_051562735.1 uncharacterized protein C1orf159-like [Myxocyprinus asiaticus]